MSINLLEPERFVSLLVVSAKSGSYYQVAAHFGDFVQHLPEQADHAKIKPGRVPHSYFWLIDGNDYIGRLILRHEVNERAPAPNGRPYRL